MTYRPPFSLNPDREERCAIVNAAVNIIASYGRRFFYEAKTDRIGRMYIDPVTKRVYWVDEYTGVSIYTHKTGFRNKWKGFSNGGTLRDLVERFRDYVVHGTQIPINIFAPSPIWGKDNIWGYPEESVTMMRSQLKHLPMVISPPEKVIPTVNRTPSCSNQKSSNS